jgi:tRNA pseudouridine-54 N-methylase
MLDLDDVLVLAPGVVSRESDNELVVVLPEQGKFVVLNETGADVFESMDGQRTLREIAAILSEHHDVPLEQVEADVLTLAGKLLERKALHQVKASE